MPRDPRPPSGPSRRWKLALLLFSVAALGLMATAAFRENLGFDWRDHQRAYRDAVIARSTGTQAEAARRRGIELTQVVLPALNRLDRCVACHAGIDDPNMAAAVQPLTAHPGDFLTTHPVEKFGCTVCHQGQGRALKEDDAHGRVEHWPEELLAGEATYTTCSVCHYENDLYGAESVQYVASVAAAPLVQEQLDATLPGSYAVARGKRLVLELGCLGCHKYRNRGGTLGPDITVVGDKGKHGFDFSHLEGEHTVRRWLFEHFKRPGAVTPETLMPDLDLSDRQAGDLVAFMASLRAKTAPAAYTPPPPAGDHPVDGRGLYRMFCSGCHGRDGQGSTVRDPLLALAADPPRDLMVPSLNNQETLAVASDHYLRTIVKNGRPGTSMIAWGAAGGTGLRPDEIDRIVGYIRSWQLPSPTVLEVVEARGEVKAGAAVYQQNCAACHGRQGAGGIGNSLNSPSFYAIASEEFLTETILEGRPNTAMPAWKRMSARQVADVIAFIRSWQTPRNDRETTLALAAAPRDTRAVSARIGKMLFRTNCATCHGLDAMGDIGISLATPEFLTLADDDYLYTTLAEGHPGTGMPAWRHLSDVDMASLIRYLRTLQTEPARSVAAKIPRGDAAQGRTLFVDNCSKCHGDDAEGGVGPQLNNPVFLALATDGMLREWVTFGKVGTQMLGFRKAEQGIAELTPRQIGDIVTYLRSLEGQPRVSVKRSPNGVPQLGRIWFKASCSQCHGDAGEGSSGPAISNPAFLHSASDGFLTATLAMGRDGTEMRPVKKGPQSILDLSSDQIDDVVAYLRSLEHTRPDADTPHRFVIPWDLARGRRLFESNCAGCHGLNGRAELVEPQLSAWAPALHNEGFLNAATDGFLQATIVVGRTGTAMRPFGTGFNGLVDMTMDEIDDLVAYIRHWSTLSPSPTTLPAERSLGTGGD